MAINEPKEIFDIKQTETNFGALPSPKVINNAYLSPAKIDATNGLLKGYNISGKAGDRRPRVRMGEMSAKATVGHDSRENLYYDELLATRKAYDILSNAYGAEARNKFDLAASEVMYITQDEITSAELNFRTKAESWSSILGIQDTKRIEEKTKEYGDAWVNSPVTQISMVLEHMRQKLLSSASDARHIGGTPQELGQQIDEKTKLFNESKEASEYWDHKDKKTRDHMIDLKLEKQTLENRAANLPTQMIPEGELIPEVLEDQKVIEYMQATIAEKAAKWKKLLGDNWRNMSDEEIAKKVGQDSRVRLSRQVTDNNIDLRTMFKGSSEEATKARNEFKASMLGRLMKVLGVIRPRDGYTWTTDDIDLEFGGDRFIDDELRAQDGESHRKIIRWLKWERQEDGSGKVTTSESWRKVGFWFDPDKKWMGGFVDTEIPGITVDISKNPGINVSEKGKSVINYHLSFTPRAIKQALSVPEI